MSDTIGIKKQLRAKIRSKREAISAAEIRRKSDAAQGWVVGSEEFGRARVIALYKACFGEVETDDVFKAAIESGKKIIYPRTDRKNAKLDFYAVNSLDELVPGAWDIPEPPPHFEKVSLAEVDLMVLPGVAFDRGGNRLGMGGGFYDRTLEKLSPEAVRMGLAYDFQMVDEVPTEKYDKPIDCLVTESGVIRFPERG